MPALLGALALFVLGLLIGSFLNVVIWRVPRGESVVSPGSHCPNCDAPIAWSDNVPVLGWLRLRGRARCCGTPIAVRYPLIEFLTGLAFAAVGLWTGLDWFLPAYLYLAAISIALTVIDLDVHRLPDVIVLPSYVVVSVLLLVGVVGEGASWGGVLRAALAGVALWVFFFTLRVIQPGSMGYGDVKLAGLLGLYLGRLGWSEVVVGLFMGLVLGGLTGLGLMLTGRVKRRAMIAYGPFLLVGAWIGLVWGHGLARGYLDLIGA